MAFGEPARAKPKTYRCEECGKWLTNRLENDLTRTILPCVMHPAAQPLMWTHARGYALAYVLRVAPRQWRNLPLETFRVYFPGVTKAQLEEAESLRSSWGLPSPSISPTQPAAASAFSSPPELRPPSTTEE